MLYICVKSRFFYNKESLTQIFNRPNDVFQYSSVVVVVVVVVVVKEIIVN